MNKYYLLKGKRADDGVACPAAKIINYLYCACDLHASKHLTKTDLAQEIEKELLSRREPLPVAGMPREVPR